MAATLEIQNIHVGIDGNEILKGLSMTVRQGEIHALMGANGSGKSTLAHFIMGNPSFSLTKGCITFDGEDLLELSVQERAERGLFLVFQRPTAIPGVTVSNFLRIALGQLRGEEVPVAQFVRELREKMKLLDIDPQLVNRYLNDGFSGGEAKRCEVLQLAVLEPKIALIDEVDSGLDTDGVRVVGEGLERLAESDQHLGALVISHYAGRLLRHLKPDFCHVLYDGRIVESGEGADLAKRVDEHGYKWIEEKYGNCGTDG